MRGDCTLLDIYAIIVSKLKGGDEDESKRNYCCFSQKLVCGGYEKLISKRRKYAYR